MPLNQRIPEAHNIQIELISDLDDWDGVTGPVDRDLRQVVVQKTYVGQNHAYALQQVGGASFFTAVAKGAMFLLKKVGQLCE